MPTSSRKKTPPPKGGKAAASAKKKPEPPPKKKVPPPPAKAAKPPARTSAKPPAAPSRPAPPSKPLAKAGAAVAKPGPATLAKPAPGKGAPPPPPTRPAGKADTKPATAAPGAAPAGKPGAPAAPGVKPKPPKKSARRMLQRRGPDGELLAPGELLLPAGVQHIDEALYILRGAVAAEHPAPEEAITELQAKRKPETVIDDAEVARQRELLVERFDRSQIESLLPVRPPGRRTFQGVVERAKHRRREIGAFLRGLDLGRTETSHMDSHGEASLQSLMEWAARLEVLAEADEPENADYGQFLRVLDQLDNTTESLVVDVELTLRRLRDRVKAAGRG